MKIAVVRQIFPENPKNPLTAAFVFAKLFPTNPNHRGVVRAQTVPVLARCPIVRRIQPMGVRAMSTTPSYSRWFVHYALLCATLLVASHITAEVSQWAGRALGGAIFCNSHENILHLSCDVNTGSKKGCEDLVDKCNQGQGVATKLCLKQDGESSCTTPGCLAAYDDDLTDKDLKDDKCVHKYIEK